MDVPAVVREHGIFVWGLQVLGGALVEVECLRGLAATLRLTVDVGPQQLCVVQPTGARGEIVEVLNVVAIEQDRDALFGSTGCGSDHPLDDDAG